MQSGVGSISCYCVCTVLTPPLASHPLYLLHSELIPICLVLSFNHFLSPHSRKPGVSRQRRAVVSKLLTNACRLQRTMRNNLRDNCSAKHVAHFLVSQTDLGCHLSRQKSESCSLLMPFFNSFPKFINVDFVFLTNPFCLILDWKYLINGGG